MSDYAASRIKKPRKFKINGLQTRETKPRYVIGFDSEADTSSQGHPMLFQFSLPEMAEEDTLLYVIDPTRKYHSLRVFLEFLDTYCTQREYAYLIYVWNLTYELTQIFHDLPPEVRGEEHLIIDPQSANGDRDYDWKIEIVNVKRQIVRFTRGKNITVTVLDGRAFYQTSLDKAAKMLGLGEKYTLAEGQSRSLFTRDDLDNEDFLKYAKRDAFITRKIGEFIALQHNIYEIPTTVSSPHFAATIFKTHFLQGQLSRISPDLEQAGLYSYHGGKNGFYLSGPHDFPDIWQYDITSAYPEAMRQLPDIDNSRWSFTNKHVRGSHALYCISGLYRRCTYRGMQDHSGHWTKDGIVESTWITSYELDAMLDYGEFDVTDLYGFVLEGEPGGALQRYVDKFFRTKQTTTGPERETAKLLLNSLYGKFFQKQPLGSVGIFDLDNGEWVTTDPTIDFDYEAGGLYHPPLASLITGFVRARIHRLEHKYEAVMTSTDGLFGFNPPDPADLGSELGQLKGERGRLRIWRERLYIFDGIDGARKYALHGFRGSVKQLEELIPLAHGKYTYRGKQMITLKLSNTMHDGIAFDPGTFVDLPYVINI